MDMVFAVCAYSDRLLIEVFIMNTIDKEILFHMKCLKGADKFDTNYWHGMTELEYHMSKIIDRLLIVTDNGRLAIRLMLGGKDERQ